MKVEPMLTRLTVPGETVTAELMVGRLIDYGCRQVPTTGSIANALGRHPMFDCSWEGGRKKRIYIRRHTRRRKST